MNSDELGLSVWRTVNRGHARVLRAVDAQLVSSVGLSARAYDVLGRLSRSPSGSARMSELASAILLSPSGATRLVDQLVNKGLVSRRKDPGDARGYLAELTKEGKSTFRKATAVYENAIRQHFVTRLTEDQLKVLDQALGNLVEDRR